jgi:hypothetical protein
MAERPDASLREIAREAEISLGTAQNVRKRLHAGQAPFSPEQQDSKRTHTKTRTSPPVRHNNPNAVTPVAGTVTDSLHQLKQDPSLRFSEIGRTLLRLLDAHSIPPATWERLVDSIPTHCSDTVARVARSCAYSWIQFAKHIKQRRISTRTTRESRREDPEAGTDNPITKPRCCDSPHERFPDDLAGVSTS